jgi:signal transduction histidine kinase/DNA-binding response OmpR family regulator
MSAQPTLKLLTPNDVPNQVLDWAARGATWCDRRGRASPGIFQQRHLGPLSRSTTDRRTPVTEPFGASNDAASNGLTNGAAMRAVYDAVDWSATPLGARNTWPEMLRLLVDLCLDSEFPVQISWGPDLLILYNDAYIPLLGAEKHPWALGRPASEVGHHLWPASEEHLRQVMQTGRAYHSNDQQLIIDRHGYPEEACFSFSVSAIRDADGTIVGLFNAITETTRHMQYERRLQALRRLGSVSITADDSLASTCQAALDVISRTRKSVPFAAVFLRDLATQTLERIADYGFDESAAESCELVQRAPTTGPVLEVTRHGGSELVSGLREQYPGVFEAGPIGPLTPDQAFVMPVIMLGVRKPLGAVVLGVNPYLRADDSWTAFAVMAARQLGVMITDAISYQSERKRQQALEELDRARTEFFQNATHELRAPLTMLLAPLQDILDEPGVVLPAAARDTVEISVRAGDRLQRVVDALLDISRAEPGPLIAHREDVDLVALTVNVVKEFRPTAEGAVDLRVEMPADPLGSYVDPAMWNTIVSNLVSNALKFTADGEIAVILTGDDQDVVLTVADTGIGIPDDEQTKIFERFERGSSSDHQPGSGIGLALVADMASAHGGTVEVDSELGVGSRFVVRLPRYNGSQVAAELADGAATSDKEGSGGVRPRLLIIEDEPDLRSYLIKLFTRDGYEVEAVGDAENALAWFQEHADNPPDMLITDVMLPGQSGLDLLPQLRQGEETARLPVVVLTALAGSESAVQAFAAGADDFVAKPFNSAELLARVRAHYQMNSLRDLAIGEAQTTVEQLRQALQSNRTTGTAVGMMMTRYNLDSQQAFQALARISQQNNRKLHDIAEELVRTGVLPGVPGWPAASSAS